MTYTSYDDAADEADDYARRGAARRAPAPDPGAAAVDLRRRGPDLRPGAVAGGLRGASRAPGSSVIEGAGHSPNVEQPEETAALIEEFAAGAAPVDVGPG